MLWIVVLVVLASARTTTKDDIVLTEGNPLGKGTGLKNRNGLVAMEFNSPTLRFADSSMGEPRKRGD